MLSVGKSEFDLTTEVYFSNKPCPTPSHFFPSSHEHENQYLEESVKEIVALIFFLNICAEAVELFKQKLFQCITADRKINKNEKNYCLL